MPIHTDLLQADLPLHELANADSVEKMPIIPFHVYKDFVGIFLGFCTASFMTLFLAVFHTERLVRKD